MAVPRVLWIRHLEDSPISIGTFTGLKERVQFLGMVVRRPMKPAASNAATTPEQSVWQAALHRFRLSGVHVGTDSWLSPIGSSEVGGQGSAREHLASWLAKLQGISYQDIHIRPFSTEIDGVLFGLVKGKKGLALTFKPTDLSFTEPWNGCPEGAQPEGRA